MTDPFNAIPSHVPPERVRDVDLYNLPGADEDVHLAWKRVQDACPDVFYTPRYGGYWVITRADLLDQAWPDHEGFSSDCAIAIPRQPGAPAQRPIEIDPPEHRYFRHPINVSMSPKAVLALSDRARRLSIELIEGFKPRGECEFVADFASHVPMEVFLSIVNLPLEGSRVADPSRGDHDPRRPGRGEATGAAGSLRLPRVLVAGKA